MNVNKIKKQSKIFYPIGIILVVSLVLNFVLYRNVLSQEESFAERQKEENQVKDVTITSLEKKIKGLETTVHNTKPENRKEASQTELEKQKRYKSTANEFIKAYLSYDSNALNERREGIKEITTEKLLNKLAPEEVENTEDQLSSDPTFSSNVTQSKLYIDEIDNTLNTGEIIADVSYKVKSSEGESNVKTFVYMKLNMDDNGKIIVNDFVYYPIK